MENFDKNFEKNQSLEGLLALLETTRSEYKYLQDARNSLHTRVGILIALLTALISSVFIRESEGFIELFNSNIIIAHVKLISIIALFICFLVALIMYIKIFLVRKYHVFPYYRYTSGSESQIREYTSVQLMILIYKEYAKCINYNEKVHAETIKYYKTANKWLICTVVFTIISIIINLI